MVPDRQELWTAMKNNIDTLQQQQSTYGPAAQRENTDIIIETAMMMALLQAFPTEPMAVWDLWCNSPLYKGDFARDPARAAARFVRHYGKDIRECISLCKSILQVRTRSCD
jgi:hypothetical protein